MVRAHSYRLLVRLFSVGSLGCFVGCGSQLQAVFPLKAGIGGGNSIIAASHTECCPEAIVCVPSNFESRVVLNTIAYDQRPPISIPGATGLLHGRVLVPSHSTYVRKLAWNDAQQLARRSAPISESLERQSQWLEQRSQCKLALVLRLQARFERSQHQRQVEDAVLNLANVYAQTTVVDQSLSLLDSLEKTLVEFRSAGVAVDIAPNRLDRQRLVAQEKNAELAFNQQRLQVAIEALLQLQISEQAIWPTLGAENLHLPVDEQHAIQLAFQNRGDLQALQTLAHDPDGIALDSLRSFAAQGGGALGVQAPLPTATWWMCRLQREIECLKNMEQQQAQRQLQSLANAKQEQIRAEVREAWLSYQYQQERLAIQVQQRELLRGEMSWNSRTGQALDISKYLENSAQELTLTSEIISTLIQIQQAESQLRHVVGVN